MHNPLRGVVTSEHYRDGGYNGHHGRDIGSRDSNSKGQPVWVYGVGRPVYAAFAGRARNVVRWSYKGNRKSTWAPFKTGNGMRIQNPDGEGQGYNHMKPLISIKNGDWISKGQLIGHLDLSGNQSAPHLHFETWSNWNNPSSHYSPKILFDKYKVNTMDNPAIVLSTNTSSTSNTKKEELSVSDVKDILSAIEKASNKPLNLDQEIVVQRSTGPKAISIRQVLQNSDNTHNLIYGIVQENSDRLETLEELARVNETVKWTDSVTGKVRDIPLAEAIGNLSVLWGRELDRDNEKVAWTDSVTGKVTHIPVAKALGNLSILWGRELERDNIKTNKETEEN